MIDNLPQSRNEQRLNVDVFQARRECMERVDPESKTVIDLYCGGGVGAAGWRGRYWAYEAEGVLA